MIPNNPRNECGQARAYATDFYIDNNDGHYHANDNNANKQQSQTTSQRNYYKENSIRSPMLPPIERRTTTNRGYVEFIAL